MARAQDPADEMATLYQPPEHVVKGAHVDSLAKYKDMYERSLKDPEVRRPLGLPSLPTPVRGWP